MHTRTHRAAIYDAASCAVLDIQVIESGGGMKENKRKEPAGQG